MLFTMANVVLPGTSRSSANFLTLIGVFQLNTMCRRLCAATGL